MVASIIALTVNAITSYVLIFGKLGIPALGVLGAAWATVISRSGIADPPFPPIPYPLTCCCPTKRDGIQMAILQAGQYSGNASSIQRVPMVAGCQHV